MKTYAISNYDDEGIVVRAIDEDAARRRGGVVFDYCEEELPDLNVRHVETLDCIEELNDVICLIHGAYTWIEDWSGGEHFHLTYEESEHAIAFIHGENEYSVPVDEWVYDDWTKNIDARWVVKYELELAAVMALVEGAGNEQ